MSLIELYDNGTIKTLCEKGLISCTMISYFDYYKAFKAHRKTCSYREAVMMASVECRVSESTIERAVRKLEEHSL
jgi:hypothetical protein